MTLGYIYIKPTPRGCEKNSDPSFLSSPAEQQQQIETYSQALFLFLV
jgi:hypothetical protein